MKNKHKQQHLYNHKIHKQTNGKEKQKKNATAKEENVEF